MAGAAEGAAAPGARVTHFARATFGRRYVDGLPPVTYARVKPTPVAGPRLVAWAGEFAARFDLAPPNDDDVRALAGNLVPPSADPYAARYGGHQFGHWAGQLGDGRVIGLGELADQGGMRWEVQLKGAGPTPFSRRADGRAVLRSSVREFVCSEAMHHLGVPTTRALALVETGDGVLRDMFYDGHAANEPGAIVTRVAESFLRIGNFEYFAATGDLATLKSLLDFTITEHYPSLGPPGADAYVGLLHEVATRTAELMSHWMTLGFVHGVMNTDNTSVLGLTIDYGPYGWLEEFEPEWTPNTTDLPGRRYAFRRQPAIAEWNLAQFGSAIATLDDGLIPALREALASFARTFHRATARRFAAKLGLTTLEDHDGQALLEELFELMRVSGADFTAVFRTLASYPGADDLAPALYHPLTPERRAGWAKWLSDLEARVAREGLDPAARARAMNAVNPRFVPRNYLPQEAIDGLSVGDSRRLDELTRVFRRPYDEHPGAAHLAGLRPEWARAKPGCSQLSCSS